MVMEDIPIFYLASKDPQTEFYWGYTGYSLFDKAKHNPHRHRVYFTDELLREIVERVCLQGELGSWELTSSPGCIDKRLKTFEGWVIKHDGGYIWRLSYPEDSDRGYVLGVWPD